MPARASCGVGRNRRKPSNVCADRVLNLGKAERARMNETEVTLIHVCRDGQLLGAFVPEFATQALFKGLLHSDDPAWTDGLTDWIPLGELLGVESVPVI
jgi:hypothetical protein